MRLSRESLLREAADTGFRPEALEKVFLLLDLLEAVNRHPDLSGKLALKGGTALNLFLFDVPRLSVDIDFNYIGAGGLPEMQADRPQVEQAIGLAARRLGLVEQTAKKEEHAGRSWTFRYASALGGSSNLKVDLVYTLRLPLWSPVRRTSRDLFDARELLRRPELDPERLRLAFVAYGAMNPLDWRAVKAGDIEPATRDLDTYLRPLLRGGAGLFTGEAGWEKRLVEEIREALAAVLPLRQEERAFLERLLEDGEIEPELLTADEPLRAIVRRHPALLWKAQNVRRHKGKP
ncbi:MAG: nucleotidyl transferase AbiEii/AbiGii toxin family protein [Janthinobacterium lividum]